MAQQRRFSQWKVHHPDALGALEAETANDGLARSVSEASSVEYDDPLGGAPAVITKKEVRAWLDDLEDSVRIISAADCCR